MSEPHAIFAERLRLARETRGMSLAQLSAALRDAGRPVSKASLVRLEHGERGPRLDEALALARVLRTSLAILLSPSGAAHIAITGDSALTGAELREWLRSGDERLASLLPEKATGERVADEVTLAIAADAAHNYVAAHAAGDHAGMKDALATLVKVAHAHGEGLDG